MGRDEQRKRRFECTSGRSKNQIDLPAKTKCEDMEINVHSALHSALHLSNPSRSVPFYLIFFLIPAREIVSVQMQNPFFNLIKCASILWE